MADYKSTGTSWDDIFEPVQSGDWNGITPPSSSEIYKEQGTPMHERYAPADAGDPGPNVGYKVNGSDIGSDYCDKGTRADLTVTETTYFDTAFTISPGTEASAQITARWRPDGMLRIVRQNQSDFNTDHDWLRPTESDIGSDYEIRATVQSGDTPSGASLGQWLTISSNREWSIGAGQSGAGSTTNESELLIEIRRIGGGPQASGVVTLQATATVE